MILYPVEEKLCARCYMEPVAYSGHRRCKSCYSLDQKKQRLIHGEKRREDDRVRTSRRPNPVRDREMALQRQYGMSAADYDHLLSSQLGVCAICGRKERVGGKRLAVDHDHESGRTRGLLCNSCNLGIGKFNDNPALLAAAVLYLED